ncbi:MAG: hypothetical protein Q9174_004815 [Haloplaca sp. 1 TL-2023]
MAPQSGQTDQAYNILTTQQACEAGSKNLEDHLRGMLISNGSRQQSQTGPLGAEVLPQQSSISDAPPFQAPNIPRTYQHSSNIKSTPTRGNANHRGRTRNLEPLLGNSASVGGSLTDNSLRYSVKPARNNHRRPATQINQPERVSRASADIVQVSTMPQVGQSWHHGNMQSFPPLGQAGPEANWRQRPIHTQQQHSYHAAHHQPQFHPVQTVQPSQQYGASGPSSYGRPLQQRRQLYNPHASSGQHDYHSGPRTGDQNRSAAFHNMAQAQINYLDALAVEEVSKVAISANEMQEKENVRSMLEDICQRAITEYEIMKDAQFDGSTVRLECFGSLRSGFATQASDMDLALESPASQPDTASKESEIPRVLEKALLDRGFGARLLTRTRVPIIRFCEKPSPELAALLQQERLKYEKERDAPPKPKKVKAPKEGEEVNEIVISEPSKGDSSAPKETIQPSRSSNDKALGSKHRRQRSKPKSGSSADGGLEATTSNVDEGTVHDKTVSLTIQQLLGYGGHELSTATESGREQDQVPTKPVTVKERRETVLPDEEIVRQYKLAMKEGWFEPDDRTTIFAFIKLVESGRDESLLLESRSKLLSLPDVLNRYRPPPEHHLDFPKNGVGVQCDINFSNRLAMHNSTMLRCYNLCDHRVKPMVLFVKAWAKRRKINSPYHGTLSSYGYVLMVLHYLVNITRPTICPNLQLVDMAMRDDSPENSQLVSGQNVRFWRNETAIRQWAKAGQITQDHHSSVGSLLRGFFHYFAVQTGGFSWSQEVLSLRTPGGILTKNQKEWTAAKTVVLDPVEEGQKGQEVRQRYLFAIEDPFEIDHNIARTVVHNGIVAIRDEFRRANRLIHEAGNGAPIEDLFAEAPAKDDLNYRYFGYRPNAFPNADPAKSGNANKQKQPHDPLGKVPESAAKATQAAAPITDTLPETTHQGVQRKNANQGNSDQRKPVTE